MRKGLALGVFLLGAGSAWLGTRIASGHGRSAVQVGAVESAGGGASEGDRDTELAELRRRLARLEQGEQTRGLNAGEALRAETAEAVEKQARKARLAKVARLPTPELEAKMFAGYFGSLDDKRRAEGVDPIWAGDMNGLLRRGAGALASLTVRSVDCGRTLCRVELTAADEASKDGAINDLLMKVGPELPQASVQVTPGTNRATAYFARNGTDLPNMESPERFAADLP